MDNYVVKKCGGANGTHFYYKNGLLHREAGPAILSRYKRKFFSNLGDEGLYKEEILQEDQPSDYDIDIINELEENVDDIMDMVVVAKYYLEGQAYASHEFKDIVTKLALKNELDNELASSIHNNKRVKI